MSDDVEAVKRALRALVDDNERQSTGEFDELVLRAERALEDVRAAAEFADADGFAALESATSEVGPVGDPETTDRARAVLDAVGEYRATAADHFHAGHEGLMPGDPVSSDETT
ncbi:hypothetical protein [Halorarum halobium]|uniref:hypothetical protein n=1 Tax=Halorarum halobium TaxID=3075121 RepID=UPI0028AC40C7|nr:hypothetical protein [Halobaculum sp. XH14]